MAVLLYLKKRTNSKEEKVPVYVRITCDGQRAELAMGKNSVEALESKRRKNQGHNRGCV